MKKTIALLLCLLSVSTAFFTACNDSDNTSSAADDKSTASSAASESSSDVSEETSGGWVDGIVGYLGEGNWGREMPEFKWDRDTFTVMVYNNTRQDTYFSEEIEPNLYDTTDAIISDAVGLRNDIIRERYGVEIKAMLVDDVYTTLSQQVQAGGDDIADAAMPFLNACSTMAQAGQLYDLREFEDGGYIDLSMPWWEQNAIDSLSVANKVYFAIGDMSIMQKIVSSAIMFNKDMLALKYPELNLYQEVKDKKWTLDRLVSISKEYTYESDNEDGMTWLDTWGYGGTYGNVISFYSAAGEKLITKDSNDIPTLAVGTTEKSVKILQNILTLLEEKDTWILHAEDMGDVKWNKCVKIFGEGRNLFRSTAFSAIKKVRVYDVNFGLIPYPLVDENQDEYYTPCSAKYAYGAVIPLSAPDPEFSAFMLDVMSAVSKGENASGLTRAYIEVVIKGKDLKADEEACEILDEYVFNNIIYDLGLLYGGADAVLTGLVSSKSIDVISALDASRDSIQSKIDEVVALYESN